MSEKWREELLALRAEIESIADTAAESSAVVELDQSKMGRLSRMDALQAQAMAKASDQRREATLRRITAALQRVDDQIFGNCLRCDETINAKRLAFDPTATLCINCASESERSK